MEQEARQAAERVLLEQCQAAVDEVLKEHKCQLTTQLGITADGRIAASVVLVYADRATS